MTSKLFLIIALAALTSAAIFAPHRAEAQAKVPSFVEPQFVKEAAAATKTTFSDLRDTRYCEVWLFSANGNISYFNTFGNNNAADPKDTCPASSWDPIDAKALATKWSVAFAYKNGPRWWVSDTATVEASSISTDFSGINAKWMGGSHIPPKAFDELKAGKFPVPAYHPVPSLRRSTYIFKAGKQVFMLVSPDGMKWVMQAFNQNVIKDLNYDSLPQLGTKLKLPTGWKFETKVLPKDLTLVAPNGRQTIVSDDANSIYNGCTPGACSYKP